jgi:hypothetical protein
MYHIDGLITEACHNSVRVSNNPRRSCVGQCCCCAVQDWGPAFVPVGITGKVELVGFDRATLIGGPERTHSVSDRSQPAPALDSLFITSSRHRQAETAAVSPNSSWHEQFR